jgi:anti-sigma factor ChrR (cupin superfamily)
MLDRLGGETGRATSIVHYSPASYFPQHKHPGGEEIFVLSGTFSEGGEHYPAGWYLRNPPGSCHRPFSDEGAVIFVKLGQMQSGENRCVRIDTRLPANWLGREGRQVCPLFSNESEQVVLESLAPGESLFSSPNYIKPGTGVELLVIEGGLRTDGRRFPQGSWIRLPEGESPEFVADNSGTTLYLRIGVHTALKVEE